MAPHWKCGSGQPVAGSNPALSATPAAAVTLAVVELTSASSVPDDELAGEAGVVVAYAIRRREGVSFRHGFALDARLPPACRAPADDVLGEAGIGSPEIDLVANCHLHADHAGQNATLPRHPDPRPASRARDCSEPAATRSWSGSTAPVSTYSSTAGDLEVVPGIRIVATPGHSPGHQSLVVEPAGRSGRPHRAGRLRPSMSGPGSAGAARAARAPATLPRTRPRSIVPHASSLCGSCSPTIVGSGPFEPADARPRRRPSSLLSFAGRARRGTSGALYLQSAIAGLNSHPRSPFSRAAASSDVEDRVPRSGESRTVSGPEGSSTKRTSSGAAERPGPSRSSRWARERPGRRWVHGNLLPPARDRTGAP